MIRRFHEGSGDRATKSTIAVTMCDYSDFPLLKDEVPPKYNAELFRHYSAENWPSKAGNGNGWMCGIRSRSQAVRFVEDGWSAGSSKGSGLSLDIQGTIEAVEALRRRPKWGEEGDEMDADRALQGEWDVAFRELRTVRTNGSRIVRIVGPWGGHAGLGEDQLFWTGVQMVVLCDLLEQAGYQTELSGMTCLRQYEDNVVTVSMVTGKEAGEPLRIDHMCAIFAHGGLFRTFGFEMVCLTETPTQMSLGHVEHSLGQLQTTVEKMKAHGWLDKDAVVIGEAYDRETAIANIKSTLHAITGGAS